MATFLRLYCPYFSETYVTVTRLAVELFHILLTTTVSATVLLLSILIKVSQVIPSETFVTFKRLAVELFHICQSASAALILKRVKHDKCQEIILSLHFICYRFSHCLQLSILTKQPIRKLTESHSEIDFCCYSQSAPIRS